MPYTKIKISRKIKREAKYVFIHPDYYNNPHEFTVAIIEMNEGIDFNSFEHTANLPDKPFDINYREVAISYHIG